MLPLDFFAVFGLLWFFAVWVTTGVWIVLDARARGSQHPELWAVSALVTGIALVYYLLNWRGTHDRESPQSRRERYVLIISLAGLSGQILAAVVAPPDPITQLLLCPIAFVCCLPFAYFVTDCDLSLSRSTA